MHVHTYEVIEGNGLYDGSACILLLCEIYKEFLNAEFRNNIFLVLHYDLRFILFESHSSRGEITSSKLG